ncbi:helix-turn-helix domain-containing protein [Algoriphagus sanaruensis]|uniref:HTH araC/xylS-type domain-containing protein n=1 Tax=Algoriphagus sanaruensis TaxID=1727163 RepID=A0A142ENT5_9BACT|nr:helix-turn-helix domain-containing protein [Algoriphagus sanaruensis]AMQ56790.1 hypothetical protein AO498_10160 [Algoriphagus sanaruensis]
MTPALDIVSFIYIAMMAISILVTIIFTFFNWKNGLFGRLMSFTLLFITYGLFTSFNASQGFFDYLPHLARTGYLVLFIVTPLLYLSLKNGLFNIPLEKKYLNHFIPALIYFINYIPFFILSKNEKIQIINSKDFLTFNEGWILQKHVVIIMSVGQIVFYLILATKNVLQPALKNGLITSEKRKFVLFFYSYHFLLLLPPTATITSSYIGTYSASPIILTYISSQIIFFLALLSQPALMYPPVLRSKKLEKVHSEKKPVETEKTMGVLPPLILKEELNGVYANFLNRIESIFEEEKPYLRDTFNQNDLTTKLGISGYQVRTTLKTAFDVSFSDFINYHRIKFLVEKLHKDPKWRNFTMPTLANSIGFKSTNSLYLAFKKFVGKTPKEFIDLLEN